VSFPNIDNKLVGLIVAFDAETGDVLHIHQKLVETVDGKAGYSTDIAPDEWEEFGLIATPTRGRSSWRLPNSASARARLSYAIMLIP
jgi:hypothetical protein